MRQEIFGLESSVEGKGSRWVRDEEMAKLSVAIRIVFVRKEERGKWVVMLLFSTLKVTPRCRDNGKLK